MDSTSIYSLCLEWVFGKVKKTMEISNSQNDLGVVFQKILCQEWAE